MKRRIRICTLLACLILAGGVFGLSLRGTPFEKRFCLEGRPERIILICRSNSGPDQRMELTGKELEAWRRELASWRVREAETTDVPITSVKGREVLARVWYPEREIVIRFQNNDGLISVVLDAEEAPEEPCVVTNWRRGNRENILGALGR